MNDIPKFTAIRLCITVAILATSFLLTSQEPIPNPWVLEYPGVRIRGPEGRSALEELLSLTGATRSSLLDPF